MASRRKEPGRRPDIEKILDDSGFEYLYIEDAPLGDFDEGRSLENQVRDEPLDEAVVELYTQALGNGDDFPAVVAAPQPGTAGYLIYDGNHRFQSFKKRNRQTIPTYLVTNGNQLSLLALAYRINTRHGKATSEKERLRSAVWLCDSGETAESAARQLGVTAAKVRAELAKVDASRRAQDLEIDARRWDLVPSSARSRLNGIQTDEAFEAAAKLSVDAGLSSQEIGEIVKQINGIRSVTKQVEYIQEIRKDYSDRIQQGGRVEGSVSKGRQAQRPTARMASIIGQIMALPEPETFAHFLTDAERQAWADRLEPVERRLAEYRKLMS